MNKKYCPRCYCNLVLDADEQARYFSGELKLILEPTEGYCDNCNDFGEIVANTYSFEEEDAVD
mgnify:CR=1 FL=1